MRRVFLLLSACLVMSMVFAQAAIAQNAPPTDNICIVFRGEAPDTETAQANAQEYYQQLATPEEQAIMDPNGDGLACTVEDQPVDPSLQQPPAQPETSEQPATNQYADNDAADDDVTALPDTGGLPLGTLALGGGFLLIGGGLLLRQRLS